MWFSFVVVEREEAEEREKKLPFTCWALSVKTAVKRTTSVWPSTGRLGCTCRRENRRNSESLDDSLLKPRLTRRSLHQRVCSNLSTWTLKWKARRSSLWFQPLPPQFMLLFRRWRVCQSLSESPDQWITGQSTATHKNVRTCGIITQKLDVAF